MYIERVPNRNSPPAILLRESYREQGKVKKRTLANLSSWPPEMVEKFQALLRGEVVANSQLEEAFEIVRSRPHGHVAAVLGTLRHLKLEQFVCSRRSRNRNLVVAMIVARIIEPSSKLAIVRSLDKQTATSTLAELLDVEGSDTKELYEAMDWLLARQSLIEQNLAKRHLVDGALVLYDLSSTYLEGKSCELAAYGYSRDGKKGTVQIVFGLLCDAKGIPLAVEVFEGNTADSKTLKNQLTKLQKRFGLQRIVLVGDRGMITEARIREELKPTDGVDWITALRSPKIHALFESGLLHLEDFQNRDWVEIASTDYPGERLVACRNPHLAKQRAEKREELLKATEQDLDKIVAATQRSSAQLQGEKNIGLRVGKVLHRFKMAKHFILKISDDSFNYHRNQQTISSESLLDGIYVIRTSVEQATLTAEATVVSYKSLSVVERAFRSFKLVDLQVRPIYHRLADRVRAHIFLCMLAYYVEWHMRAALAPILFDDDDKANAAVARTSVVAPAQRSAKARHKAAHKLTSDGLPVHSFQSLLADLATVVKNTVQPKPLSVPSFDKITQLTPVQQQAFDLLGFQL
jgi:transposase